MKKIGILLVCLFTFSLTACQNQEEIMDAFVGTPHIFIAQDGKVEASVSPGASEDDGHPKYFDSTEEFDELMNQFNLVDTNKKEGEMINITYAEYLEMLDKKESFVAIVTQTSCGYCQHFKENVLDSYISENGVKVYEINITLEEDPKTVFETLKEFNTNEK